jgi:hypothetical protein
VQALRERGLGGAACEQIEALAAAILIRSPQSKP